MYLELHFLAYPIPLHTQSTVQKIRLSRQDGFGPVDGVFPEPCIWGQSHPQQLNIELYVQLQL